MRDPLRDTHRGRLSAEWAYDATGLRYRRYILRLKQSKTDPTGEENWEVSFRIDRDAGTLSAGAAIADMLGQDPDPPGVAIEHLPLFRNPLTDREISYADSRARLDAALRASGNEALASGLHSLRIGGATALASDPAGGEFVAGCAGLWTSD